MANGRSTLYIVGLALGLVAVATPVLASSTSTPSVKTVALTFDDGPYGTSTAKVLSILQERHVRATFFLIGQNVAEYPDIAKLIVQDGNAVGNHTYSHPANLILLPQDQIDSELLKTGAVIASTTGVQTRLFRPPYGKISRKIRAHLELEGYKIVLWNVDPKDWNYSSSSSSQIVTRILNHLKAHMVIVLHDGRDTKVNYPRDNLIGALPTIIDDLRQRGYRFITIPN